MERISVHGRTFKPFIAHDQILAAVHNVADQINHDYAGKRPLLLSVLNGAFMFTSDLMKGIHLECELGFIRVSSYEGTQTTGKMKAGLLPGDEVRGRDVIIIEDIVDTGNTYQYLYQLLQKLEPASIAIATLLYKPEAYQHSLKVDYTGISVGTEFLIGYGLDYDGLARNLADIYVLDE